VDVANSIVVDLLVSPQVLSDAYVETTLVDLSDEERGRVIARLRALAADLEEAGVETSALTPVLQ